MKKIVRNKHTYNPQRVCKPRGDSGFVNPDWVIAEGLHEFSRPLDWFEAFISDKMVESWTKYTNVKAMMSNAGQQGQPYPDFKPFEAKELQQHIGVVLTQGISPSPRVTEGALTFKNHV